MKLETQLDELRILVDRIQQSAEAKTPASANEQRIAEALYRLGVMVQNLDERLEK